MQNGEKFHHANMKSDQGNEKLVISKEESEEEQNGEEEIDYIEIKSENDTNL